MNFVRESLGIFGVMCALMALAIYAIPLLEKRIPRSVIAVGFIPSVAFFSVGMIGHDIGAGLWTTSSMFAVSLIAMFLGPQTAVFVHLWKIRSAKRNNK